jgi:hypothetical protein
MVVDGRWRQSLGDERMLPGDDIAAETGSDAVVAVVIAEEALEAIEVQGNLVSHGRGTHAQHRQLLVATKPAVQAVLRWRLDRTRHADAPFVQCFCGDMRQERRAIGAAFGGAVLGMLLPTIASNHPALRLSPSRA